MKRNKVRDFIVRARKTLAWAETWVPVCEYDYINFQSCSDIQLISTAKTLVGEITKTMFALRKVAPQLSLEEQRQVYKCLKALKTCFKCLD